jgi:hypothetical protein
MEMGTFTAREDGVVIEVDAIEGSKVAEDTKIMVVGIDTQWKSRPMLMKLMRRHKSGPACYY